MSLKIVQAQNYVVYDVKPDDTPQSIAQANNISLDLLLKYNPDLKNTKAIGQQKIVIPKAESKNFGFLRYRVKTKETLYSISKSFNLSIADIKAFNPNLYDRELQAGEVLKLPAYKLPEEYQKIDFNQSIKNSNFSAFKHIVLPGEKKADIASKYGMSIKAFDSLNQNIIEVQTGQLVKVIPSYSAEEENSNLDILAIDLQYYEVPRHQTLYSLTKEFKVSEDIIYKLNPIVRREGLKAGMIIKLPKQITEITENKIINLENYVQNYNEKKLALFLPFSLDQFKKDSVSVEPQTVIKKNKLFSISLDIYQGVKWAIDYAKSKGIYTDLKIFDTKKDALVLESILTANDLNDRDAIIGPITNSNVELLSKHNSTRNIPVFIPISKSQNASSFVFNTLPKQNLKTETLITYIDSTFTDQTQLVFIIDSASKETYDKYKYTFPNARFFKVDKPFVEKDALKELLNSEKDNMVILETDQIGVSESVINHLYSLNKSQDEDIAGYNIKLLTSDRNEAFGEVINNAALCALSFTYVSTSKNEVLESNDFIQNFIKEYGYAPNKYVTRAFDMTYDILLRLAYDGDLKDPKTLKLYTEYTENRFSYNQAFMEDVYHNQGLYIIKYNKDFDVEILN
ncbi:LysM peptidoglycan-binding domain-containing protein [Flavobacterium sp. CS20]|uniref:LysM peptidoglycan-binding domain-containing protein n=1 Tax=Flavobacterium sp. CS20 TaxID=2775246 RepID=UPI001B3A3F9E|nr:LysM peptidoglycan-binding domain-containing protein [Flavobacterium sp. CS20]QTY25852.1 LysM peptidoglycan-binding domain-containing protein [Flavobacterium sp. CS20]